MTDRLSFIFRALVTVCGLGVLWQAIVWITQSPPYILPGPLPVLRVIATRMDFLAPHAAVTVTEILLGLLLGTILGVTSAILIHQLRPARRWLFPLLVISQAIPVFAIAPVLVLWLGYGMASKVAMATLIIYFPVTASFMDGLRRTESGWLDLATTMIDDERRCTWAVLWHIRIPAALPALASGLRVAAAVAPIGAVVGEWVGASAGLGYVMLHANGRMQIDLMFAALIVLSLFALAIYSAVDGLLRRALPWQPDSAPTDTDMPARSKPS
tara:strand:+ start:2969 stop:3778 length:810 start_codon:yes stop_codon:yes gene_type:complete